MYRAEELHKNEDYHKEMMRMFVHVDSLAESTHDEMNFLQRFGAMHVGSLLAKHPKCRLIIQEIQHYEEVNHLIADKGLPADWAFTVFNIFFPLHCFLRKKEKIKATFFRDFLFQNYAYKLRGVKRVAFMANFFASMHYDFTKIKDIHYIRNLNQYVFANFDSFPGTEVRIYVTFTRLIMADVETQLKDDDFDEKRKRLFRDAKLHNRIMEGSLQQLWSFLILYKEMIEHNSRLEFEKLRHRFVMVPECRVRWRKAICSSRHYEKCLHDETLFATTWKNRLRTKILFEQTAYDVKC